MEDTLKKKAQENHSQIYEEPFFFFFCNDQASDIQLPNFELIN